MKGNYRRFTDKVAMVTGAGMGIGEAVATALAHEEASVVIFDFDASAAASVVAKIEAAGGKAVAAVGSVSVAGDVERAVNVAVQAFGGLDLLVNNAGVVVYGEAPDFLEDDWDKVLDTNLKGQFLTAKYAVPRMRERGGGAIVNLSSVQALLSQRQVAAYAASKGGVVSLTKSLALDHAKDKIRVNCVLPGSVRTPMLQRAAEMEPGDPEETMKKWGRIHPRGTIIEPEELAAVILFLLSDDASAVTGAPYVVDAGFTAQAAF